MIGTALVLSTWLALVCGADPEPAIALPILQRIDFSAAHPETWPKTNPPLEAIPREEFERLWSSIQPQRERRPPVVLERAVYQAAVVNQRLQGGTLTAEVYRPTGPSAWFRWTPFNLALGEARWQDGPAVFGADASGQHWLLADRERREFFATWSALGRRIGHQTEFSLSFPEAITSTVVLRVPRGQKLACSDKSIPVLASEPDGPWVTWRIDLGSRTQINILVRAAEPEGEALRQSLLTYQSQLSAEISEDHLRFQAAIQAEVLQKPIQDVEFSLPKAVELYSVTYGTDTSIPWTRLAEDGTRVRVRVTLPDAVMGELRAIRLEGLLPRRPNTPTVVPQVELMDAVFLGAQHTVTLLRPLQLASVKMTGCRESAVVTPTAEGESYQFHQFLPDALLMLEIRRPTSQLTAQTLSAVTFHPEEWQQRTEMTWNTLAGSAFRVSIQIPQGWELTDVDSQTLSGVSDPMNWDLVEDSDNSRLLNVEFLEAITQNAPRLVRLFTRQRRLQETRTVDFPVPRPVDVSSGETLLVLQGGEAYRVGIPTGPAVTAVSPANLPDSWRAFPLWATLMREDDRQPAVWCRSEGMDNTSQFLLEPELIPADVVTNITATIHAESLEEMYELNVRPVEGRSCERVLAYINEAGGEWTWNAIDPPDRRLESRRLPTDEHRLWNFPIAGELWELRLDEAVAEWQIRGVRRRDVKSPVRIGLLVSPQARTSQSSVAIQESLSESPLEWTARGLQEDENTVSDGQRRRRWQYSRLSADLTGTMTATQQQHSQMLIRGALRSNLSQAASTGDIHELRLELRGVTHPFTLTLPAGTDGISARINGETIEERLNQLRIPASIPDESLIVEWIYRALPAGSRWSTRQRIPWPEGYPQKGVWTQFEWELNAPPHMDLDATCAGLRSAERSSPIGWRRRLFGPLARPDDVPMFLPWQRETWENLLAVPADSADGQMAGADTLRPVGWTRRNYYGPAPPAELLVDVVDLNRTQSIAWLMVCVCALSVLILRASRWVMRDRAIVVALTGIGALSFLWSGPWTDVFGGCIAGIMCGGLLPRRWWQSVSIPQRMDANVPAGSTQSFVLSQPLTVMLVGLFAWGTLTAADPPKTGQTTAIIYVPVDADGRPSKQLPFVYLASDVLKHLRSLETGRMAESPAMLMERADYRVTLGSDSRAGFSVTYRILSPRGEATVCDLLLPSVTLSGQQSCLVDGRPAAVSALPEKRGLRIQIPAEEVSVSAIHAIQFAPHEITLDFDHPWRRSGVGGHFELPLPQSALSRVEIGGFSPTSEVQFESAQGGWERSLDQRQASVALGASGQLRFSWQERAALETRPPQSLHVTTAESLDVTAAAIEVHSRSTLTVNPQQAPVTHFTWDFPPDTHFRNLQIRPSGRAEISTLKNKNVRVEVEFYEPVLDAALEAQYVVRHSPQLGEFVWRGLIPIEQPGMQFDRPQRLWAVSSAPEIRVQPQSVENSGLVPVAAESVREQFAGLSSDRTPQMLFQVGSESPVAFRWTTATSRRRLLVWQQRGEVVGSRLRWTVEADLECATQPPAYNHTFLVDRRLQIEDISVRERGAERRLRWTESRASGSPQTRVTVWLTDPCLETQRITLTAQMPLSTTGPLTLPNVRCEDAELIGGRWEFQSTREFRGTWQALRGLKSLSSTDDRLETSQHWIFEQTDLEPRAVIRFQAMQSPSLGHALFLVTSGEAGQIHLRSRWEMAASEMLAGLQIQIPRPWKLSQSPSISGMKLESEKETEHGVLVTLGEMSRSTSVIVELEMQAQRADLTQRQFPLPQLSHDPGFVTWVVEAVPPASKGELDGLSPLADAEVPDWVATELNRNSVRNGGQWRSAVSLELPQEWPRYSGIHEVQEPRVEWLEHRVWWGDDHRMNGTTRAWMESSIPALTVSIPAGMQLLAAEVDGQRSVLALHKPDVWSVSSGKGVGFREIVLYWESTRAADAPLRNSFTVPVPQILGQYKTAPLLTAFPPPGREFMHNFRWRGNDWVDRGLQRLEVLSDHLTFHANDEHAAVVAQEFRSLYERTAEKFGRHTSDIIGTGTARSERWTTIVSRMNQAAPLLANQTKALSNPALDDLLLDHPDACYQIAVNEGQTAVAWLIPAGLARWLSALAMILFGYPLLGRGIRTEWSPWLNSHAYFSAALLGIVWWFCLAPSLAGLALAIASILSWLSTPRAAASPTVS